MSRRIRPTAARKEGERSDGKGERPGNDDLGVGARGSRIGVFADGVAIGAFICYQTFVSSTNRVGKPSASLNAARAPF